MLSWGGDILTRIRDMDVAHEVLMTVAQLPPSRYINNGASLEDVEMMASKLVGMMLKDDGVAKVNLEVLSHVHSLALYAGNDVLGAEAEAARLYVRTVLQNPRCRSVCLPQAGRSVLRSFLIKVSFLNIFLLQRFHLWSLK